MFSSFLCLFFFSHFCRGATGSISHLEDPMLQCWAHCFIASCDSSTFCAKCPQGREARKNRVVSLSCTTTQGPSFVRWDDVRDGVDEGWGVSHTEDPWAPGAMHFRSPLCCAVVEEALLYGDADKSERHRHGTCHVRCAPVFRHRR